MRSAGEVMPKVMARLSRGAAHEVLHVLAQRRGTTDERDVRWLDESDSLAIAGGTQSGGTR